MSSKLFPDLRKNIQKPIDFYSKREYSERKVTQNEKRGDVYMCFKYINIEAERVRKGLTKEAIAKEIGVSTKTYYNYLTGKPIPSTKLVILSKIFDCSIDYLLDTDSKTA